MVDEGYMEVKTDFAEQTSGYDDRSVAKKMVDAYESLFTNQITNSTLEQLSYSIAGAVNFKNVGIRNQDVPDIDLFRFV